MAIKKEMQLTKAEEQIMQMLWEMGEGLVKDIRDLFEEPRPARNTVSTVVRVLEKKKFVGHRAYGNVYVYYPDGKLFQQLVSGNGIMFCTGKRSHDQGT